MEHEGPAPRFSLVVPAWNEEAVLPRLLDTVDVARARFHGGPQAIEVIVADNASTDRTTALARDHGCTVVPVVKRSIAAARNGGAREDFESLGGYEERRPFAEDVALLIALKRLGRARGQTLARVTSAKALASMRKFHRHGDWHYFPLFARLGVLMLRRPYATTERVRRYWYEDDRG